ncbi:subtilisin-like protease SBT1.9 [Gossypium arboreum]|uniref:subtilisin-like protease SBT1.9 n=1 Tax=Gossypium arboreum TaxID=29729 RepID=UPI0008196190|nr:subtilisin-like protease SBT1.9 [Gossypium arboreum]
MVKTRKFVEGDSTLATKAVWDDELTLIFCELCVNEVNAATGENAWAPSSGVLPSGVLMGDDTPNEGFGDSDENSNENESIPPNEVPSNPPRETPNQRKETLGVVHGKEKKSSSSRKSSRDSLATHIKKLCESIASPRKSVNEIVFPHSEYTISNAMDALRNLGDEIPKKDELYYFAIKMSQIPVKREVFWNLHLDVRVWWLQRTSTHGSWYFSMLSSISDTSEAASASSTVTSKHLYTYTHSINGFSATLTLSKLESLKKSFGYLSFTRDRPLTVHTTHTSQFLGLNSVSGAWTAPNYGEDVIIGIVDSGIWPESESYSDEGMAQVPTRWKGKCESGTNFSSSFCNKKLIGARFYNKGLLSSHPKLTIPMNSPRDINGHGTHTSSIAAGNSAKGASYFGYASGTANGMAPRAHIAMYKVVWRYGTYTSDVLAAIDQAIQDGVDILSLSLGLSVDNNVLDDDPIAVATFAAMEKGIFIAASAGNDGPLYWSLVNGAPWMLTVAAGSIDREFDGILTLGNGVQITFESLYPGNFSRNQMPLVVMDECASVEELRQVRNNIIVCKDHLSINDQVENAESAMVSAAVFISNYSFLSELYTRSSFPAAFIGLDDGQTVIDYIKQNSDPRGRFQFRKTRIGTKPAPKVDAYSSRGPFLSCPNVLKPDILAPGSLVLASWSPVSEVTKVGSHPSFSKFNILSGTSMAAPHAAGVAALVKRAHPDWSPAAIRSAIMTTANPFDNNLSPIKDVSNFNQPASPLDIGAGHINPIKALDPGLVYDAKPQDYMKLLCAMNYTSKKIRMFTKLSHDCMNRSLDLNYPAFIAFFNDDGLSTSADKFEQEFQRTVTNVGKGGMAYTAKVTGMDGIKVMVEPPKLVFKQKYEKQSYKLRLEGPKLLKKDVMFGALSWRDDAGKYMVTSPIMATTITSQKPIVKCSDWALSNMMSIKPLRYCIISHSIFFYSATLFIWFLCTLYDLKE